MDGQVVEQLATQLRLLLQPEDDVRQAAENSLEQACSSNPEAFMAGLLQMVKAAPDGDLKKLALFHFKGRLRKYFHNSDKDEVWCKLSDQVKAAARETPIWVIMNETEDGVRKAAVPLLADLAAKQHNSGEWPSAHRDLLQLYIQHVGTPFASSFLQVVGELVMTDPEILNTPSIGQEHAHVCQLAFQQGDIATRCVAIVFLASTVVGVPDRSHWTALVPFGKELIITLKELASGNVLVDGKWIPQEEEALNHSLDVVGSLVEIAESSSSFFKPYLTELLDTCFAIVKGSEIDEDLRQYCAEIIMSVLSDKPKMCQKVPNFTETMMKTSIELMVTVEEHQAIDDDVDYLYSVGERGIDAVVKAVGGGEMLPIIFTYIKDLIVSKEWQQRFAGIICICQTTEYINKCDQLKTLQDMVPVVLQAIRDEHQIVRLAAARCIGQMAYDLSPVFQVHYCKEMLDALIERFTDTEIAVVNKSLRAYVNFCDELTGADIAPYMERLLEAFVACLQIKLPADTSKDFTLARNIVSMRENAVNSISVSAAVAGKRFVPYYSKIAHVVIQCVTEPVDDGSVSEIDDRAVRAQAVECISHIGAAVGCDVFANDGVEVMKKLLEIKADQNIQDDDPILENMFEAFKKMVGALGPHFKQFVPRLMEEYVTLLGARDHKMDPWMVNNPFDYTFYEGQEDESGYSAVKTSVLMEMCKCLSLIQVIAETNDLIDECLQPVIEAVQPLIKFRGTRMVIGEVCSCLSALLNRMSKNNAANLPQLIQVVIRDCFEHIKEEHMKDLDSYAVYLAEVTDGLAKCIKACGKIDISQEAHEFVIQNAFSILNKSIEARQLTIKKLGDPNLDDEDREKIESDAQIEQTFRNGLINLAGSLMANNGARFVAVGGQRCQDFITQAFSSTNPDDIVLGIFLCDDILCHLKDDGVVMWPLFMEKLIDCCKHPRHDVRQAAAYGIVWAAVMPQFTPEMVGMVIQNLAQGLSFQVLGAVSADDEEVTLATDNIVAALHALIVHKHDSVDATTLKEMATSCYQQLPLKSDYAENLEVCGSLVTHILAQHVAVLGENNCNLPLIVAGLSKVYKTMMSSDALDTQICECIKKIGEEQFKAMLPSISTDSLKYVERLWRDVFA